MNHEKSKRASSPARLARLAIRISSPLHCPAKASMGSIIGRRRRRGRILNQHALGVALRQHDDPAIAHQRQRGQGGQVQALGFRSRALGFQAQVARGEQQVIGAGGLAGRLAKLVAQRRWVGGDVMQAGDQAQGIESAMSRRCAAFDTRGGFHRARADSRMCKDR